MIVVADTGPLLALAKIEGLPLLAALYRQVLTGPTVYTEAVTAGLAMNAVDAIVLEQAYQVGLLLVQSPSPTPLPQPGLLHAGEVESIQLAIELKADYLLIDDLDARQAAQHNFDLLGLKTAIRGTLGVIVTAVQAGVMTPSQAIEQIQLLNNRVDVWLSSALCETVIKSLRRSQE